MSKSGLVVRPKFLYLAGRNVQEDKREEEEQKEEKCEVEVEEED